MPRTKEEIAKILEKNYKAVQVSELEVYDKTKELDKSFSKDVKELATKLKSELKQIDAEEKSTKADFKQKQTSLLEENKKQLAEVESKKETANKENEKALEEAKKKHEAEIKKINQEIDVINKENEALVASVLKEYEKNVETSKKTIVTINEKGVKDQNTFKQKLEDIETKHNEKVAAIDEEKADKLTKLKQANLKEVSKLEETIENEKEKHTNRLNTLQPVYEEELEEIDENIEQDKLEYEEKHESIRSSADQRIAVREKHLHRAMDEGNNRSVKEHKRDIEKFRKEADKDLVQLRKNYNQKKAQQEEYRKNFIKENLEKLAEIEKEFNTLIEEKQLEIDRLNTTNNYDVKNMELDYDKLHAEEKERYNEEFASVREKQEEVLRDQELDLEKQEDEQIRLKIEFDKTNKVNEEKLKENLEQKAKELRDADIELEKDQALSKEVLDATLLKLDNEKDVSNITLAKDKTEQELNEKIAYHKQDQARRSAQKEELLEYEQAIEPLYLQRAEALLTYEAQEIDNRYDLKEAFIEKERELIKKDNETLLAKINEVYALERAPFDKDIEELAGIEKAELAELEETHNVKLSEMKEKLASLNPRRDKKAIRALEDDIHDLEKDFRKVKDEKHKLILASTHAYEAALHDVIDRNEKALDEAQNLFNKENARLTRAIDLLNTNRTNELDEAKSRYEETIETIKDFLTKSATRNSEATESNTTFLNHRIKDEEDLIEDTNKDFTHKREELNDKLNRDLNNVEDTKKDAVNDCDKNFKEEEHKLENFKDEVNDKVKEINHNAEDKIKDQSDATNKKAKEITNKYELKIDEVKDNFKKQKDEFNDHIASLNKKASEEKHNHDSEQKRIEKESEQRLKNTLVDIQKKLQSDISNIQ